MISNMMSLHGKLFTRAAQIAVRHIRTSSALQKNLYEALGLTRDATQADIKNAYFELSKIYHPDRIAATDENLARFREISDAYEILGNEQSRKLYDRGLVGDFRRPGVDEAAEITDPIVKFYKKRQDMKRTKSAEELETWAQTHYKEVREKAKLKSQFYTVSKQEQLDGYQFVDPFCTVVLCITVFLFLTNYNNNLAYDFWNKVFGLKPKHEQ